MMRIGHGFDVHRFAEERPLIIGGVTIPYEQGLAGHSDADVLLHAVSDALLGAAALGDIGTHFPDTDPRYKDLDSTKLFAQVGELVKKEGWVCGNIDATIIAERPKMAAYIGEMRQTLAQILYIDMNQVNVKATTTEKLGFTGRAEGIAAEAVVLLRAAR